MWQAPDRRPTEVDNADAYDRCECHVCQTLRVGLESDLDGLQGDLHAGARPRRLLLTTKHTAELLSVTGAVVRSLVRDGEVRLKDGGQRRIPRAEVDDYISRC